MLADRIFVKSVHAKTFFRCHTFVELCYGEFSWDLIKPFTTELNHYSPEQHHSFHKLKDCLQDQNRVSHKLKRFSQEQNPFHVITRKGVMDCFAAFAMKEIMDGRESLALRGEKNVC